MYGSANFTELFSDYLKSYNLPSVLDVMPEDDSGIAFKQRFIDRNYYKELGSETEELFTMHLAIKCSECVNKYLWKINIIENERDKILDRLVNYQNEVNDTYSGNDEESNTGTDTVKNTDSGNDVVDTVNSGNDTTNGNDYYNPVIDTSSDNIINKNKSDTTYGRKVNEQTKYGKVTDVNTTYGKKNTITYGKKLTRIEKLNYVLTNNYSTPELIEQTIKLNNIYEEALEYLDILFMGVL